MKTITQVIKERPEYRSLIEAVVKNIGKESIQDVVNHGINVGFGGFIYYADTVKFWRKHRKIITRLAEEQWQELDYQNLLDMISGFRCNNGWTTDEVARAFYGNYNDEYERIYNCLAWYAAEEVCNWFMEW